MKTPTHRGGRGAGFALALVLACPELSRASVPQLRGVLALGPEWRAALATQEVDAPRWYRAGERVGAFTVVAIDCDAVTLAASDGSERLLALPHAKAIDRHAPPANPAEWAQWVHSTDNPMLHRPATPPVDLSRWRQFPAERRRALLQWYQAHGWKLEITTDARGGIAAEFAPLLGRERQAIRAAQEHAFRRTLPPDLLPRYIEIRRSGDAEASASFAVALPPDLRSTYDTLHAP